MIDQIDTGNSNLTEDEALNVIQMLRSYADEKDFLSKYAACEYLGMSRATFDNYIRDGKLPKGQKLAGFKELVWHKSDLKDCIGKFNK